MKNALIITALLLIYAIASEMDYRDAVEAQGRDMER